MSFVSCCSAKIDVGETIFVNFYEPALAIAIILRAVTSYLISTIKSSITSTILLICRMEFKRHIRSWKNWQVSICPPNAPTRRSCVASVTVTAACVVFPHLALWSASSVFLSNPGIGTVTSAPSGSDVNEIPRNNPLNFYTRFPFLARRQRDSGNSLQPPTQPNLATTNTRHPSPNQRIQLKTHVE